MLITSDPADRLPPPPGRAGEAVFRASGSATGRARLAEQVPARRGSREARLPARQSATAETRPAHTPSRAGAPGAAPKCSSGASAACSRALRLSPRSRPYKPAGGIDIRLAATTVNFDGSTMPVDSPPQRAENVSGGGDQETGPPRPATEKLAEVLSAASGPRGQGLRIDPSKLRDARLKGNGKLFS